MNRARQILALLAAAPLLITGGCRAPQQRHPAIVLASQGQIDQARAELGSLAIKGRSPKSGYSRALFLPHNRWPSIGHGCTVRDRMVTRDLTHLRFDPKRSCHPVDGVLNDPYSGATLTLADAELDHVVPLADAYAKGAQADTFTPTAQNPTLDGMRRALAVDPDNLLMVSGSLNVKKRHADIASWVPPNKRYRCTYAVKIIIIKARYRIWVTPAEHQALTRNLSSCPASGQTTPIVKPNAYPAHNVKGNTHGPTRDD